MTANERSPWWRSYSAAPETAKRAPKQEHMPVSREWVTDYERICASGGHRWVVPANQQCDYCTTG
jgi:hypothetical protein